jgi:serine protease Do
VVEDAEKISVTLTDGRKFTAKVVGRDPQTDIAVIKVDSQDLPAITLANSDRIEVGDVVLAVGNPFGLGQTVTSGIVSAKGRATLGLDYEDFIQTDAAINPGNSGGALVDADGRLVGINTAILSRSGGNQGIGFAVPVNLARWVMDGLVENGSVQRGFLGVMIQDVNADLAQAFDLGAVRGALVSEVTPDSPADKAGLKSGDVITEFNGKSVEDSRRLKLAVGATEPGKPVEVTVIREGNPETFKIALRKVAGAKLADGSPSLGSRGEALAGVGVADLDGESRQRMNAPKQLQGVVVTQVEESSPAYEAGLRPGDVITEINRNAVKDADEAMAACEKSRDVTLVKIWRNGVSRYMVVDETKQG